ncbi:two-component system OmpR family sensor kinase [Variovorax sp. GrIS 2.14]|uniref:ATP-binding protein n=1 Tax=Variovorax sp. GrIS 2.14 TaxID=3071709 RepID=UPI0038F6C7DC
MIDALRASRAWGRPHSLRGQLLWWLLTLHLIAAGLTAWSAYVVYGRLVHNFMDDQMRLVAESYTSHHRPPALLPLPEAADLGRGAFVLQLWSADGTTLLASSWPALTLPLQTQTGFGDVHTGTGTGTNWRVYTAPGVREDQLRVQVVQSDDFRRHRVIRRALFEGLPIALLLPLAMLILWIIVTAASRSLRAVARDVVAQDERSLSELSVARVPEEIMPLVDAFNGLLARLRAAFATQRRFVQDAAHELRSPIAAITLQIEALRPHVASDGDAAQRFAQLEAGVTRARRLVDQLLSLSRQEAPPSTSAAAPVDLAALLRDSIGSLMVLADQRGVDVGFEGQLYQLVDAPASELRCVFDNLIDNALRYTKQGTAVDVRLHAVEGRPVVDVIDHGPGIPSDLMGRVFDRFFRAPGAAAGGSGLGLSIAQAAAARHGMRIALRNRSVDEGGPGVVARVYLPVQLSVTAN